MYNLFMEFSNYTVFLGLNYFAIKSQSGKGSNELIYFFAYEINEKNSQMLRIYVKNKSIFF